MRVVSRIMLEMVRYSPVVFSDDGEGDGTQGHAIALFTVRGKCERSSDVGRITFPQGDVRIHVGGHTPKRVVPVPGFELPGGNAMDLNTRYSEFHDGDLSLGSWFEKRGDVKGFVEALKNEGPWFKELKRRWEQAYSTQFETAPSMIF